MKNVLGAKQVNKDIRKNYYASENFLNKVTDTLLRLGLMHIKDGGQGRCVSALESKLHVAELNPWSSPGFLICDFNDSTYQSVIARSNKYVYMHITANWAFQNNHERYLYS